MLCAVNMEYSTFLQITADKKNKMLDLVNFFLQVKDVEKALDVIELSFRVIDTCTRDWDYLRKSDAIGGRRPGHTGTQR